MCVLTSAHNVLSICPAAAATPMSVAPTDYRRGKRFKKLVRILGSAVVQAAVSRFKLHTAVVVAFIMAVHIAIFVIMYIMLEAQKVGLLA